MYKIILISMALLTNYAFADEISCRNVTVKDSNPYEEGLGVFGDTYADEDSQRTQIVYDSDGEIQTIFVGQMTWDGEEVNWYRRGTTTTYVAGDQIKIKTYRSERGIVLYKPEGQSRYEVIATIDCSEVPQIVYDRDLDASGVQRIRESQVPEDVMTNIQYFDVAFEMGDGYFDVTDTKYYKVVVNRQVVGYLVWYKLSYTEDDDEPEVIMAFDRNGLRLIQDWRD